MNFKIKRTVEIPEIQSTLTELEHLKTGAQILHIGNDDPENVFNLSFRTWPETGNGVAHVLEHTVLCGSEKFPVRDPFFGMNRRSLNTFMNALTGADFTCYPASTQVPKDFYNLLEVYLDAVFHPLLSEESFLQEGCRLEFATVNDAHAPLLFKGIVFNEMKGAMSTGDARLGESLMGALFPNLTYGVNSGGDPHEIPNLTHEELKAFHAKFYHPSRCLFYFYGNLPLEKHLEFLEEHAFSKISKIADLPLLPAQPRFSKKVYKTLSYPISEEEESHDKTMVGMGWLTTHILEQEELLALNILDVVLMGTDAAPLKKALLKSGLCKTADASMDNEMSEIPFFIVCKGCEEEGADKLEELIRSTLQEIVLEGIGQHLIDGAMHQIEMARTEIGGNSTPYGLLLFFRSGLLKQHGGNPEDGLRIHSLFSALREKVQNPRFLPSLIEKHLLNNPHFVHIKMLPDQTLTKREIDRERQRLDAIRERLTPKEVLEIIEEGTAFEAYQKEDHEENYDFLPKVTLKDVNKEEHEYFLQHEQLGNIDLYHHACFTNQLIYADLVFDLPHIPETDLHFLRLFSVLLPHMGCGGRPYDVHLEYLLQHTGGIGVSLDLGVQANLADPMRPFLSFRAKALSRKQDKLFAVLQDMIVSSDFTDIARLKELLIQHFHSLENSIQHSSLRYAVNLAASGLSTASKIAYLWYGLDYFWKIKEVLAAFEANPQSLVDKLETIRSLCLGLEGAHLILSCDEKSYSQMKRNHFYGLGEISTKPFTPWHDGYNLVPTPSQGRIIASPVAFTTLLFPSISYEHPDAVALSLAAQIMEHNTLHRRIREQGGAYGGGAANSILSGYFYFYAYRDPHLFSTLQAFEEGVQGIAEGDFDEEDLREAQLCLFQDLDLPIPPGMRAITAYARLRGGRTPQMRQKFRDKLFSIQKREIQEAAKRHLLPGIEKGVLVTFAGKEFLEQENALLGELALPIFPV